MRLYNDYELIYLIQGEKCEAALKYMFQKYDLMIKKYLYKYNVKPAYFDDFHQEAIILMNKIIGSFNEEKGKTFTRFFELVLKRKIFKMLNDMPKYNLDENIYFYEDKKKEEEIIIENLTDFEEKVFNKYFIENQKISFIALNEKKNIKQIYNAIYRIKEKYKNNNWIKILFY